MTIHTDHLSHLVVGPLSDDKAVLRRQLAMIVLRFQLSGRKITKCRTGIAPGASFTSNHHPNNGIVGVRSPLTV